MDDMNLVNKSLIVMSLITSSLAMHAMEQEEKSEWSPELVITKPYTPSFIDQHYKKVSLFNWMALGALGATSLITKNQGTGALALGAAAYLWKYPRQLRVVDSLLIDPANALKKANKGYVEFFYSINETGIQKKSIETFHEEMKRLQLKGEKHSPIFLLNECTQKPFGPCFLSRTFDSKYREYFNKKVCRKILSKLQKQKSVHIVSFGAGELFHDLESVVTICAQIPDAQIEIHSIDFENVPYALFRKIENNGYEISVQDGVNATSCLKKITEHLRKELNQEDAPLNRPEYLAQQCLLKDARFKQFLTFAQKTFPRAQIRLFAHSHYQYYLEYVKKHATQPDILTAVDIDDQKSRQTYSTEHYKKLCVELIKINPHCDNLWLVNATRKALPQVYSISLESSPEAVQEEMKNDNDPIVKMYISSETII